MTEEGRGFGKECSSLDATFTVQQRTWEKNNITYYYFFYLLITKRHKTT
jgi:hypothetical protein